MPFDSNGVWFDLPNIEAVPGQTIESADWNGYRSDLRDNYFNTPRTIIQGGTGASNAADARTNLGIDLATTAEYLANVPNKILETDETNAAGAVITLTDSATITWDMGLGINAAVTLGGNRTMANPLRVIPGRSGALVVTQDATGSRTLTWGTNWSFAGGLAPTLSTAAGSVDVIFYWARSATDVIVTGNLRGVT